MLTMTRQRESIRLTPLGFCLRVIVNENPLNLEKTTSSVLLLINLCFKLSEAHICSSTEFPNTNLRQIG